MNIGCLDADYLNTEVDAETEARGPRAVLNTTTFKSFSRRGRCYIRWFS